MTIKRSTLLILSLFLLLSTPGCTGKRIEQERAEIEPILTEAYSRLPEAERVLNEAHSLYPAHYSQGLDSALTNARTNLEAVFAPTTGWLAQLSTAQAEKDWKKAEEILATLGQIRDTDVAVVNQILGPPETNGQGLFDQLAYKVAAINNGYLATVQTAIDGDRIYVTTQSAQTIYLCGSFNTLSFQPAFDLINQAQVTLNNANITAVTILPSEEMADLPLAYDLGQSASTSSASARRTADQLIADAANAPVLIASCNSKITEAEWELTGAYDYWTADLEYQSAKIDRDSALQACYSQNFNLVSSYVNSCISHANASLDAAEPPPPTPVPQDTSPSYVWPDSNDDSSSDDYYDYSSPSDDYYDYSSPSDDYYDYSSPSDDYYDSSPSDDYFDP